MIATTHRASRIQFDIANEQRAPIPGGKGSVCRIHITVYANTPIHTGGNQEDFAAVYLTLEVQSRSAKQEWTDK